MTEKRMESSSSSSSFPYTHLLEKTRLPHPSFQRYAVISIFDKLRSSSSAAGAAGGGGGDPGRDAITRCLTSSSPAVADQAVRETCRLVLSGHLPPSSALLELQSALDGSHPSFAPIYVKAIGFLSRSDPSSHRRLASHPFIKVLSSRPKEVQAELIHQVLLSISHNNEGIEAVIDFLRPFLIFSVIHKPSASSLFARDLISSVASLSCSIPPSDAICVIRVLTRCLKYFPSKNEEEIRYLVNTAEYVVDALVVVLKRIAGVQELQCAAQSCSLELLDVLQSLCTSLHRPLVGIDIVLELSKRLLVAQKLLNFPYLPEFVAVTVSVSLVLTRVEFEHEQLLVLKILIFLVEWKAEKRSACKSADHDEELLLLVFPVVNLFSYPSRSVKAKAVNLLSALETLLLGLKSADSIKAHVSGCSGLPSISKPESIASRLINHLWFQEQSCSLSVSYLDLFTSGEISADKEEFAKQKCWTSQVREYLLTIDKQKYSEDQLPGMSLLLISMASILAMYPTLSKSVVDLMVVSSRMDPKLAMPVLLFILFYTKMLCSHHIDSPDVLIRLLELLPSVAAHSDMVPLVVQTILPMLHKGAKPVLYAAAVRLLCKTWIVADRAFGTLQGILDSKALSTFNLEGEICLSIAASIRDVCKHNADRGVDLILSVSSCIESRNSAIQALGFEGLAHLCEADVVDFYTAWNVIAKHTLDYSSDPIVAHSLCTLLKWGAMDAEVYHDDSKNILHILWEVASSRISESLWVKARVSAFKSLSHYEVARVQETIADFRKRNMLCLTSERNPEILKAIEEFEVKIINYEHATRRRLHKPKRIMVHKVDKLLDVFPQVMFSPGKQNFRATDLPGAALLTLNFAPKDFQRQSAKDMAQVHAVYENALKEIAESLHIPRNIFVAFLALESWKSFINQWLRATTIISSDTEASSNVSDRSSKVAFVIFKAICRVAQHSIPRVSVNMAFAVGALCLVVPLSAHSVIPAAVDFLLTWLFEYEHEHKQWPAAISLGLVSNCFHATDRNQKFRVVNALLKVLHGSKSHLVSGACGSGLGFACQDLLTMVDVDESSIEGRTSRQTESMLLMQIVRTLSLMLCKLCPFVSESLRMLIEWFSLDKDNMSEEIASTWHRENSDNLEEDTWGIAGLVLGLGNSVAAIYRIGSYDAVLKIKDILISWIALDSSVHGSFACKEMTEVSLSVGSCLVLPTVVAFCQRVELMDNSSDFILERYVSLISELLNLNKSGILHQNFLMASCIGAGSFLSCVLGDGVHSMKFDDVKHLLEILRSAYMNPYPPIVRLGGLLGVVNAFGAGAGNIIHTSRLSTTRLVHEQESSFVRGPILSTPICEPLARTMVQEMFMLAKDCMDHHIQSFAAWAVSFLRQSLNAIDSQMSLTDTNSQSQSLSEESLVWNLCLWLRDINYDKTADIVHGATVQAVLRCLSEAPRLPSMDWGPIIRRLMRHERQLAVKTCIELGQPSPREECIRLCLAHASNINAFLLFLDELTDQSRFRTLEQNLQSILLLHLSDLVKTFSSWRLEKLFEDFIEYFSLSSSPFMTYDIDQKILLQISFWKGLHQCLAEASNDSISISKIEKCMECLFRLLPALTCNNYSERGHANSLVWSEAIRCLSKAPRDFLVHFLQLPDISLLHGGSYCGEVAKLITARARLVRNGRLPISELGKIKACVLNARYQDTWWIVLMEVVAAVSTAGLSIKRQWLLDGMEISCIADDPLTVLRFIGLLSGSCSKYMPLLIIDPDIVLSDLPVTLPSLLSDSSWNTAAETLLDKLWASTERICSRATESADRNGSPNENGIDRMEARMPAFLARVMHQTCLSLKDYLPFEKQLRLASMEFL